MKTKYLFGISVLILSATVITGCKKDFLEVSPQGQLTDALFPKTEGDLLLALNGAYAQTRVWQYHSGGFPLADIMSDDNRKGSNPGDGSRLTLFDNFTYTSTASDIFPWYSALYQAVKAANVITDFAPDIEMDATKKNRFLAEARFLRAMSYFNLVRAFGAVPKVTTIHAEVYLERSPASEVYNDIIISDLEFAAQHLPEKSDYESADLGRATRGAAKSLLAKAYLYMGNFAMAESYALEVINSGQYDIELNFTDVFSLQGQNGIESIFEIGALPFETTENGGNQFANTQGVRGTPNRGWGFNRPSPAFFNAFDANDVRRDASIIVLGEVLDGVLIEGDISTPDTTWDANNTNVIETECYNQKVWLPGSNTTELWGFNVKVLRYAEILLIAAEAMNENGNGGGALQYLNEVRNRAGLDDVTETDQSLLRDIILNERRLELAMEGGNRFYDLVRTGKASQFLGPLGFQSGKHELFPIPQSEIDLSGGTLTQNAGW